MTELSIDWSQYRKYCGSGVMPATGDASESRHPSAANVQARGTLPAGTQIALVPSYQPTPAERAGIQSGDVITHALSASQGWVPVTHFQAFSGSFQGPVFSTVDVQVVTPSSPQAARLATIQKEWIVYIGASDPLHTLYPNPADLRAAVTENLHQIPLRAKEDEACELISAVSPSQLMQLPPLLPKQAMRHHEGRIL